ncbi:penicillin-binding protein [Weissella ceti]|uniref:Penicillin-binding protein n=1 Tax=Weissella ceti TaxID=759620 RepID=A0ABT3E4Y0_9LACO|nr:transglycosylase domain-containing protein [Weissella ceti]MCW0953289.1 penicillin-binding protein [Weissella ceti]QVK11398.1 penicillin-binding protein [Weissella ceti]
MADEHSRMKRNTRKSSASTANKKSQKKKARQGGSRPKRILRNTLLIGSTVAVIGMAAGGAMFTYYAATAPQITDAALRGTSQTQLLDSEGRVFYTTGNQTRQVAKTSELPKELRDAVVAIEDRRFYQHHGVDPRRIIGATFANIIGSSLGLQGGSTLTQQLVKLTVFSTASADQTIKRKAQEAYLATKVEKEYSKNDILTLYMNKVYMGNGVYGMKTAAKYYYGKAVSDLTPPEIALLAGLPQSPSGYDPYTNPEGATKRRNDVLSAMATYGTISDKEAKEYMKTSVTKGLTDSHPESEASVENAKVSDAYITSTLNELTRLGYEPARDGLKVKTNLNSKIQERAYQITNGEEAVAWPNDDVQVGLTVTDPKNGGVLAQIGGRKTDHVFGLNRATQRSRSAGSTAKPIVDYGPAIEYLNWPTYRALDDKKYTYPGTDVPVNNWDNKFEGPMTMREALAKSRNIPAIQTFEEVGTERSSKFLEGLGINIKPADMIAGNAIGIDISSEQEAAAFSAFSNGGQYFKPTYVSSLQDQAGVTKDFTPSGTTAMTSATAFMTNSMMQSVISDSYANIVATSAYAQAGKTGVVGYDTDIQVPDGAASDAWFTGFTKSATISTWVGYDQPNVPGHYLMRGEEQYLPLRTYSALMNYIMSGEVLKDTDGTPWETPNSVNTVTKYGKTEYEVSGATFNDPGLNIGAPAPSRPSKKSSSEKSSTSSEEESSSSSSEKKTSVTESSSSATSQSERKARRQAASSQPA